MTHHLTIELPDSVYGPLAERASASGQTVEQTAQECLIQALILPAGYGKLRKWAGAFSSGVPDAASRHDEHIGQDLCEELQRRGDN